MAESTCPQVDVGEIIKTTKGDFQNLKKLGEGGFGAVYKVRDMSNNEVYAMKTENSQEKVQVLKMEVVKH